MDNQVDHFSRPCPYRYDPSSRTDGGDFDDLQHNCSVVDLDALDPRRFLGEHHQSPYANLPDASQHLLFGSNLYHGHESVSFEHMIKRPGLSNSNEPPATHPQPMYQVGCLSPVSSQTDFSDHGSPHFGGPGDSPPSRSSEMYSPPATSNLYAHGYYRGGSICSNQRETDLLHASGPSKSTPFISPQLVQQYPDAFGESSLAATPSLTPAPTAISDFSQYHLDPDLCNNISAHSVMNAGLPLPYTALQCYPPIDDSAIGSSLADDEMDDEDDGADFDASRESDHDWKPNTRTRKTTNRPGRPRRINGPVGQLEGSVSRLKRALPNQGVARVAKTVGKRSRRGGGNRGRCDLKCPDHPQQTFRTSAEHRKHLATCGNPRPFPCLLQPLCQSSFGSKNEWKRHIATQHLLLGYYRCHDCEPQSPSPSTSIRTATALIPNPARKPPAASSQHNDFNRKDLFTQHIRRMHLPAALRPQQIPAPPGTGPAAAIPPRAPSTTEWESQTLPKLHESSWNRIRLAPQSVTCTCKRIFQGANAWEERVECLGRHFEGGKALHGQMDGVLVEWMAEEGLLIRDEETEGGWNWGKGERVVEDVDAEGEFE
ncbi:MAG: hypothetical protein M1814_002600 [Vezdaea aestivalis]|nr:MAG: hypothetical protein M1814_002600 [Vezdaea aestivalis]